MRTRACEKRGSGKQPLVDILRISLRKCRKQQHKYMSNSAVFAVDLFENCINIWSLTFNSVQNNF